MNRIVAFLFFITVVSAVQTTTEYVTLQPGESHDIKCGGSDVDIGYFKVTSPNVPLQYNFTTSSNASHINCVNGTGCRYKYRSYTDEQLKFSMYNGNEKDDATVVIEWACYKDWQDEAITIIANLIFGLVPISLFVIVLYKQCQCMRHVTRKSLQSSLKVTMMLMFIIATVSASSAEMDTIPTGVTSYVCSNSRGFAMYPYTYEDMNVISMKSYPDTVCSGSGRTNGCDYCRLAGYYLVHPFADPDDAMITVNVSASTQIELEFFDCYNDGPMGKTVGFWLVTSVSLCVLLIAVTLFQYVAAQCWKIKCMKGKDEA